MANPISKRTISGATYRIPEGMRHTMIHVTAIGATFIEGENGSLPRVRVQIRVGENRRDSDAIEVDLTVREALEADIIEKA